MTPEECPAVPSVVERVDDEKEEAQLQRRSGWRWPLALACTLAMPGWLVRVWRGRALRVDGSVGRWRACRRERTGGDATSAHMYICAGLRLSSADQVAVFFSAFWLRSSVVSVLISLISDIQAIGL